MRARSLFTGTLLSVCAVGIILGSWGMPWPAPHLASASSLSSPPSPNNPERKAQGAGGKMDAQLRRLKQTIAEMSITNSRGTERRLSSLSNPLVRIRDDGKVQVYIELTAVGEAEQMMLTARGITVELANEELATVQAWIPLDRLEEVTQLPFVKKIKVPDYAIPRVGSKTTEGNAILRANELRARGFDGSGVRVGVISDGIGGLDASKASGDLPSNVKTVTFPGTGAEGTAMLEIVHDLAPGGELGFCGPATSLEMVRCVQDLATGFKADIIVDDLGFFAEPFFEDGPVAKAVAGVVANGVFYTSSAGNEAQEHYEANFIASPNPDPTLHLHNFGAAAGGATDDTMGYILPPGAGVVIFLQWNDPFGQSGNDYDLYLSNQNGTILAKSEETQTGNGNPFEALIFENTTNQAMPVNILVNKFGGADRRLEFFAHSRAGGEILQYKVPGDSIFGHPAIPGVLAAAAISASDPGSNTIEPFSSLGPSTIFFPALATRAKPDVTAIDGVSVTGAGGFPTTFFGTSAASPHVAGVAALLKSRASATSATEIANALINNAVDLGTPGKDTTFGAGRIDALAASDALPFGLTVKKAGTGSGTVTSTPAGINCGTTCSASFALGTSVTLTAAAANGSTFGGWSGGACGGTGTCTVSDGATVTATFNAPPPPPSSSAGGGGCTIVPAGTSDAMMPTLILVTLGLLIWSARRRSR